MDDDDEYTPPYRALYSGLVLAIIGNVLIWIGAGPLVGVGNLTAVLICFGAIWLIRRRQTGRL